MIRLLLASSLFISFFVTAKADSLRETVPSISSVGEAVEEVTPDIATLRFGVVSERASAAEAAQENAKIIDGIVAELKNMGVGEIDVQTQDLTLTPVVVEDRDPKGKPAPIRKFYRAQHDLAVRLHEMARLGDIAGKLIDKGVNSFQGVDFDYSDPPAKRDVLRAAAMADARRRAEIYAQAAGLRLARILEIRPIEEGASQPRVHGVRMAAAAPSADRIIPLQAGSRHISARVEVVWALSR
jgi:uncharacterized protein YggE